MTGPIQLTTTAETTLYPCAPFHFDGTFFKPSYFPGNDTAYSPGHFWQTLRFEHQTFGLRFDAVGSVEEPAVRLTVFSGAPLAPDLVERIAAEQVYRYGMHLDLRPFYDGFREDPRLAQALERWRGLRPSSYSSLYEYLVIATLLQNTTVRRTVQMNDALFARFGMQLAFDGRVLSAFWPPEAIRAVEESELRALKLGYRAKTIKRQAESFGDGPDALDEAALRPLDTPELKRRLLAMYGIGPASVWYLLFGQFKRCEVFETISPWEQKIFSRLLFGQDLVEPARILDEVERCWGKWKMLAAHILFEDLFWQRRNQPVPWLEELIRL
jgi:3-methyladenine DNA glycosylase/8-oxoguanine DNA glycosylase